MGDVTPIRPSYDDKLRDIIMMALKDMAEVGAIDPEITLAAIAWTSMVTFDTAPDRVIALKTIHAAVEAGFEMSEALK